MNQKELNQSLNAYWKQHKIFQKSLDQRSEKFQSITYDGPPFASGTPHFGHGLVGSMKDTILRYKTMKGYKVNRERGRDCHGLPVEKFVEKLLGIDGKRDIEEKIGVEKFVEECRKSVSNTSDERRTFGDLIGRRADMDHAYYTMNLDYMESVIRVIQNMYNQNLVYKGFNVQWMCPSCATTLSNSEVNEGYKDRQDPAITIKFPLLRDKVNNQWNFNFDQYEMTSDGFVQIVDCIIKRDGKIFMNYSVKAQKYLCPGGKVEKGDTLEGTVKKEISEELGVAVKTIKSLGNIKQILRGGLFNLNMFEIEIEGEPKLMEPEKLPQMVRAEIVESDNSLGFAVKIENTIVDDDMEIMSQFYDLYLYQKRIFEHTAPDAKVSVLAWTTTPWTLPSNMFLAVGNHIRYSTIYDISVKEYFVIAENLLKQYYRDPKEYILIKTIQGEGMVGLKYEPLFQHINKSKIANSYKEQFFKIIPGEFVSTEDGTGIVHIAPAFGMEDFNAVAQFLPREDSKKWLFLPVNEYGEFTEEVPERKGTRVYDTNKDIIQRLKEEGKLIGQRSYEHSYPHCRRCDTALISKALTSWFIKEPSLTPITVPHAEEISFVPETVKKRFIDVIKTAPDRNLARNRYRGAPLPIWENTKKPEDIIVAGTLEEIYQGTKTGSQNITKNIVIRHGKTDYNETHIADSYSKAVLNKEGIKQAKNITKILKKEKIKDAIIVVSPLQRTLQTITPYLEKILDEGQLSAVTDKYIAMQKIYQALREKEEIHTYIKKSDTQKLFQLYENIYMDFRITDVIIPEFQDKERPAHLSTSKPTNELLTSKGESMDDVFARNTEYIKDINTQFQTKTIITITHEDSFISISKAFKEFDYLTKKQDNIPENGKVSIRYRDNNRNMEMDLHKPYVDSYRFKKGNKEYRRIPEVMDCWFESGSMPFGQAGYTADHSTKPLVYPADFIIEGLDQTRGWFRGMHVVGNAVMKKNSFNNVIINGLILAEDGKKMSKKLNNYPDPEKLFGKYGTDAYRLYLLASPGVRAEAVRFSEKGVEQVYKDFTASIMNGYKFFETYANVDKWTTDNTALYFMRHAKATGLEKESQVTEEGIQAMKDPKFIEQVLRINPDIIYTSPSVRTIQTAEAVVHIMKEYRGKKVKIKTDEKLWSGENMDTVDIYKKLIKKGKGQNILVISHDVNFNELRPTIYNTKASLSKLEAIKLPTYSIDNELDKRILAELHNLGIQVEQEMNKYFLDTSAKLVLGFIEKLNNWFIRRSRRRFRASGMGKDKHSAFNTLFEVLQSYMKICASFAPFVSEHIYLELQKFTTKGKVEGDSIHLKHFPLYSEKYIDKQLLEEIEVVRRIISLGLFIRSKNKMAVKQPLAKMQIKL
ncbi:MAG: class I tRNA ligase family protein [Candidatus Absconditabacterales bacterium]